MFVDLRDSCSKIGSNEELPAFYFGLYDDEAEVGFGVHIAGHYLYFFDLGLDTVCYSFDQAVLGPSANTLRSAVSTEVEGNTIKVLLPRVH